MDKSPLFLDGWLEFNRFKWNLEPIRIKHAPEGANTPLVEAVLYANKAGRIVRPALNPYFPVAFTPTPTQNRIKIYRQWLTAIDPLVRAMYDRGLGGTIRLSPNVDDVRPWQWAGFRADVKYTLYNDLPVDLQKVDPSVRKNINKAKAAHYTCERTTNMTHVLACLQGTQERQGINHGHLTASELDQARALLGDEHLRAYVCYAPNGTPASARLSLHIAGSRAIDWIAGTQTAHLSSGATQLLIHHVMDDLHMAQATGFDFAGAEVAAIAASKVTWGGCLIPFYTLEAYNLRSLAKWGVGCVHFRRARRNHANDAVATKENVTAPS